MSKETPLTPGIEEFQELCRKGNLVSVYTKLTADFETPLSAYRKIDNGAHSFLLESAEHTMEAGRYSFLGSDPRIIFEARGKTVRVTEKGETRTFETTTEPLAELEQLMARYKPAGDVDSLPAFHGGAVGYLAYDAVRYFEPSVPAPPPDQLGVPDMLFIVSDTVVIFDHRYRCIIVVANVFSEDHSTSASAYAAAREKIDGVIAKLRQPLHFEPMTLAPPADNPEPPTSNTTKAEYMAMVEDAMEYIHAGDIFQVVPSQRFEVEFDGQPIDLYRALRHVNPSPYMFCLQFPDGFALVGSSPEVHVRSINGKIDIRPIAGTRWRGITEEEDNALAEELLADPKERAEHIMLVDLARNDVGRIAEYGSVEVNDFMIVERYSHVMHIVSNVTGKLAKGRTAYDVMRATFPAGTVSGSPKVRAMQIINSLEKSKRCAYAGAVGYFGFDGNHDSCIALRTCVLKNGKAYIQAGAGVVADSQPEYEYTETVNKAMAMLRALAHAQKLGD
ncbi:MAG: anthranilate synthase component I [Verrucomicrobia bacterium]|nr:anthranilate synthase component I [Verrucomicrobiota bacterium]